MTIDYKWWGIALLAGIIYAVCAVLRLAIYNLSASGEAKNYFLVYQVQQQQELL